MIHVVASIPGPDHLRGRGLEHTDMAGVCTENLIRVADVMESPKLTE